MLMMFILFPTFTFIYCYLTKANSKWIPWLLVLEVLFYCLNKHLEGGDGWTGDIIRYMEQVSDYKNYTWQDVLQEKDYFMAITSMMLSNMTENKTVYILFYGLIFAGLSWLAIRIVIDKFYYDPSNKLQYLFLVSLVLVYSCRNINALRFSIATIFYLWCILEITIKDKKWFYLIILFAPIIHFSYWIFILVLPLWFFLKNKLRIVQIVFVLSFLCMTPQVASIISHYSIFFGSSVAASVDIYAGEGLEFMNGVYAELNEDGNLSRSISRSTIEMRNYGVSMCIFIFSFMGYSFLIRNKSIAQKISLVLISFAIANIASSTSNGVRFYHTACAIGVFMLFYIFYELLSTGKIDYPMLLNKYKIPLVMVLIIVCFNELLYYYIGRIGYNMPNFLFGNGLFLLLQ